MRRMSTVKGEPVDAWVWGFKKPFFSLLQSSKLDPTPNQIPRPDLRLIYKTVSRPLLHQCPLKKGTCAFMRALARTSRLPDFAVLYRVFLVVIIGGILVTRRRGLLVRGAIPWTSTRRPSRPAPSARKDSQKSRWMRQPTSSTDSARVGSTCK